jgi:DNA mismatch repair protein MutS
VERIAARIALRQVRPRELLALRLALDKAEHLAPLLPAAAPLLARIAERLAPPPGCADLLVSAIKPDPSALVRDGGVIATGHDAELDELRAISDNCDDFLLKLEVSERERTGISNLRVQFNRVHGFYIEVTQSALSKVPDNYRRRQTLKNAERFITPELKAFEDKALSAQDRSRNWPAASRRSMRCARWPSARTRCTGARRASWRIRASRSSRGGIRWWRRGWPKSRRAASSPTTRSSDRSSACR